MRQPLARRAALLLSCVFSFGIFLALPVTSLAAVSASFDCAKARSAVEKMVCSETALADLDSRLGQLYTGLLSNMRSAQVEKLRQGQKSWLAERNRCGDKTCLEQRYKERLAQLNRLQLIRDYAGQPMEVTSVLEQTYDNTSSIVARFNLPIDESADFRRHLQIERGGQLQPNDNWLLSEDGLLAIYPFIEPQSKYHIQVKPGLLAITGVTHAANRSFDITTRRSTPTANFAGSGSVMSPSLKRALPVTTLDVDEVDIDFFRIAPDEIALWSRFSNSQRRNYYQLDGFTKTHKLAYSGRFPLPHRRHQRTTLNLDLSQIRELNQTGGYLAVLRIPGRYNYTYDTNFFTVSNIGLQVRRAAGALHVLSHSLVDAKPLADIQISLYKNNDLLAQQQTDARGIATFTNWYAGTTSIIARHGDELSVIRLDRPLDLSGIRNAVSKHQPTQVFAWGPRDLYRPGETVETFALLRDFDGRQLKPMPLWLTVIDAAGTQKQTTTLNREQDGTYHFSLPLGSGAKTGTWKLIYRAPASNEILHEYKFSVEDFLPERMKLTLFDGDPTKRRLVGPDAPLQIPVAGDYLYGAPASGNKVDGNLIAELDRHPFEQWSTYSFGIAGEKIAERRVKLAPFKLDDKGRGNFQVDLGRWSATQSPLALTCSASLYESGGRPVTRNISVTRVNQQQLVGIEPQFNERADNNSRAAFKLILTDAAGAPQAGSGYQMALIREDRNYYWTYNEGGGWQWHYDPAEYEVYSGRVTFNAKGGVSVSAPVKWGNYRLEVRDSGNRVVSSYRFRTRWYWWGNNEQGIALKPDQVRMTFEDEVYHQGETAHLLLTPPTDGLATITVENNDEILWVAEQKVKSAGTRIEIPIPADWHRHDIYVTATVLTPGDMRSQVAPKRAFGFVNLPLERVASDFNVAIEVPERVEPGQQVEAAISLDSGAETPQGTYVTLAAVDVGVLNITRFATPDPAGYFYAPRRYGVSYYDIYGQIIENAGFAYTSQRFGGGLVKSAAELSRGGEKPKSDVKIIAWQSKPVAVDAAGKARIPVTIPEFNGRLRWMAVVYSDQRYGKTDAETTVADKLVTQLSKPRFLALGDSSQMSLDLSNQSGLPLSAQVKMQVDGALGSDGWQQSFSLEDGAKTTLRFPLSAGQLGRGNIHLQVTNSPDSQVTLNLKRDWFIDVRSPFPAVSRKAQAIIKPGVPWTPQIPLDDLDRQSLQARLVLSPQPPIDVNSQFDHLLHYPYGCTEQSTSSTYPWVLLDVQTAQAMGLQAQIEKQFKRKYTDEFRKEQIEKGVARVLSRQNANGGFSYWSNNGDEINWLTVYVADFLTDAQLAGAEVPAAELGKTLERLQAYVRGNTRISYRWSETPDYYSFATRAYAAYVLSKVNRLSLADLRRFYDGEQQREIKSPLPWAHLGFAFDMLGDRQRAEAAYARSAQSRYDHGYDATYGSDLRDQALLYTILAKRGRADDAILLNLFELTKRRDWLSTQERNALFRAAMAILASNGGEMQAKVVMASGTQELSEKGAFTSLLDAEQLEGLQSIETGDKTLYASLELVGHYHSAPPAYGHGLSVVRDYFDLDGKPLTLTELKSGDLVVVRLRVGADARTPDGLVVDLLPAGLELENQNLKNASVDLSKILVEERRIDDWRSETQPQHLEYRDDRFVAALSLEGYYDNRVSYLYYLARAVTPGTYLVPPPYFEDMYRPERQALGVTPAPLVIKE